MRGFLRYLCFYCASRLIYETARGLARKQSRQVAPACQHHVSGFLIGLAFFPIALLMAFGALGLFLSK